VIADDNGRISFSSGSSGNEYGIFDETDGPDFIAVKYFLNDSSKLLKTGALNKLYVDILNRGGDIKVEQQVKATLRTSDKTVQILVPSVTLKVNSGNRLIHLPSFELNCEKTPPAHGEPYQVRLFIDIEANDTLFTDEIILPLLFDAPCFDSLRIDDGYVIKDISFGEGNGDGIANPGERILLFQGDHKLRLFTNDPWIIASQEELIDQQIPAIWEDGYTLSSVVSIDKDCPDGHIIEFTGYYETNTWNPIQRNLHWGKVFLMIRNPNHK
jgi:hypothetical protein